MQCANVKAALRCVYRLKPLCIIPSCEMLKRDRTSRIIGLRERTSEDRKFGSHGVSISNSLCCRQLAFEGKNVTACCTRGNSYLSRTLERIDDPARLLPMVEARHKPALFQRIEDH